jgi:flagellar biogenesis protein FliO
MKGKGLARMERQSGGAPTGGLAAWLIAKLRPRPRAERRLELLERILLAPRQSLALVEAEGRRILVATSAEGGPAFYPLDEKHRMAAESGLRTSVRRSRIRAADRQSRISW